MALLRLELCAVKVARTVLRRGSSSNAVPLSDAGHLTLHWDSNHLQKLQHEKLWSLDLRDNQAIEIFVAVVEHDTPPWDLDDVIGSIKIKIKNQQGKITSKWSFLGDKKSVQLTSSKDKSGQRMGYLFQGGNSKYEINFHLMHQ